MRNILLTLFLFSSLLFAKDANNNPEKVIEDFFYHFNEMDINKINELWDLPITYFVGDEIVVASSALDLFGLGDFCCKKIENQLLDFISLVQNRSYLYNRISI